MELRFALEGPEAAVTVTLCTDLLPSHLERERHLEAGSGARRYGWRAVDLSVHLLEDPGPSFEAVRREDCRWVNGHACWHLSWGLRADPFLHALADGGEEALWSLMLQEYQRWTATAGPDVGTGSRTDVAGGGADTQAAAHRLAEWARWPDDPARSDIHTCCSESECGEHWRAWRTLLAIAQAASAHRPAELRNNAITSCCTGEGPCPPWAPAGARAQMVAWAEARERWMATGRALDDALAALADPPDAPAGQATCTDEEAPDA